MWAYILLLVCALSVPVHAPQPLFWPCLHSCSFMCTLLPTPLMLLLLHLCGYFSCCYLMYAHHMK